MLCQCVTLRTERRPGVSTLISLLLLLSSVCFTSPLSSVPELASVRHFFFPLSLFYSFSLCCCIYLSPRAWQGAITLSSRSCAVLCFSLRLFLLLAVVLVPLPRPPAPSIPLCSLCARSVSRALTSRCDPTEPR